MDLIPKFFRSETKSLHQLPKLVDHVVYTRHPTSQIIICDIDKTYLETRFESIFRMAKIPFEGPNSKLTVPGARDFLRTLRWEHLPDGPGSAPRQLHFVSSSPPMLRSVFEEKLRLDFLDCSSTTFKNQAYNIRAGRFDLLRHQIGYKSLAILRLLSEYTAPVRALAIGDSAEHDAFTYLTLKLLLAKRLEVEDYRDLLLAARVDHQHIDDIIAALPKAEQHNIDMILIRDLPAWPLPHIQPLTQEIKCFGDYFQALLQMLVAGWLDLKTLSRVLENFSRYDTMPPRYLRRCLIQLLQLDDPRFVPETLHPCLTALSNLDTRDTEQQAPSLLASEPVFLESHSYRRLGLRWLHQLAHR